MEQDPASDQEAEEASPVCKGFEYRVRLAVSIPLAWAEFLRGVALTHYDWKCRESATAGVVNGLRNTACDAAYPSSHAVEWRDLDLLAKIMEQANYHVASPELAARAAAISRWIRWSKDLIVAREQALATWSAAQISPSQGESGAGIEVEE